MSAWRTGTGLCSAAVGTGLSKPRSAELHSAEQTTLTINSSRDRDDGKAAPYQYRG
jgi:hypothetical protein